MGWAAPARRRCSSEISQLGLLSHWGAQGVINPLPASGGVDPDSIGQTRTNAPVSVTALDRLVSVSDYADFLPAPYAGIGKATSVRLSDGRTLIVYVTIAGVEDSPIDTGSDLYNNLHHLSLQTYMAIPIRPVHGCRTPRSPDYHAAATVCAGRAGRTAAACTGNRDRRLAISAGYYQDPEPVSLWIFDTCHRHHYRRRQSIMISSPPMPASLSRNRFVDLVDKASNT